MMIFMKMPKLMMLYCYFLRVGKICIIQKDVRNGGPAFFLEVSKDAASCVFTQGYIALEHT